MRKRQAVLINKSGKGVAKMKKRTFAILTIATLIAALVVVALPGAAAASGVIVRSKMVQGQEPNQPESQCEVEEQTEPEDLNCPSEQQDNYPPEEECKPPETTDTPPETNSTPSQDEELPCTAGNSTLYVWLGLAVLFIGAAGMTSCKVMAQKDKA